MKQLMLYVLMSSFVIAPAFAMEQKPVACEISGCSGQLCVKAGGEPIATTCEYKEGYSCFGDHSTCEVQADGVCGWTPSIELTRCLEEKGAGK